MGAFGIVAICPSTNVNDRHTFGYATERTSGRIFAVSADSTGLGTGTRLWITAVGDVIPGPFVAADLANAATEGFLYIRAGDGAPTGTPSNAGNGRVATYYDRTNDALYVYNGGWVSVSLS